MTLKTKAALFSVIIFIVIYVIIWITVYSIFDRLSILLVSAVTVGITAMLSPKEEVVKTQSGDRLQLRWLFFNKVITLK